ncbi:hypothetical protein ACTDI5_07120 [Bacillus paralicheniformis]|uniref:hypothetical protein n=1 Tax=Bacillus paralicheniformis TaxID=1648923 RepID=UPI003F7A24DC
MTIFESLTIMINFSGLIVDLLIFKLTLIIFLLSRKKTDTFSNREKADHKNDEQAS